MIKILENTLTVDDNRSKYEHYLREHISAVQQAYYDIFEDVILTESDLTVEDITKLEDNIRNHDNSKYYDEEFYPYLHWFYPEIETEKNRTEFDYACLHHYHHNPHHWNHWILNDDEDKDTDRVLDMPEIYVIEMLCDWQSFSKKNPESTAYQWWIDNQNKMKMTENTISLVNKYIKYCKEPLRSDYNDENNT